MCHHFRCAIIFVTPFFCAGIISVLVLIAANYCLGLAALWRSNLLMLAIFTAVDIGMAILCLFGTHQYHQHMGNIGALVLFIITSLLSLALLLLSCRQKAIRQSASIQTAAVNCYHHVLDDWYDYAPGTPGATSDKEELITNQLLMPYHGEEELCVEDFLNSGSPPTSGTFCTVESTEERYLNGNRYAL